MSARARSPFTAVHDIDGPKVRLGVVWFVVLIGAALAHRVALGGVLGVAAALAADEVLRLHVPDADDAPGGRLARVLGEPNRLPVLLAAGAVPLAAVAGSDALAGALVAGALVLPAWRAITVRESDPGMLPLASLAVPALGLAAAAPVLLHRMAPWAAIVLIVLVSAYDAGDFIVGTGAATDWEGPAAGVVAVGVCAFVAAAFPVPPLDVDGAALLGLLTALLAPFGPPLGSVLVGGGAIKARYVRRLDVLLLVAPVAVWAAPAATG